MSQRGQEIHEESEPTGTLDDRTIPSAVECISAVTMATGDMGRAVRFYRSLGFTVRSGGEKASFTSLHAGSGYLNLIARVSDGPRWWWGRW